MTTNPSFRISVLDHEGSPRFLDLTVDRARELDYLLAKFEAAIPAAAHAAPSDYGRLIVFAGVPVRLDVGQIKSLRHQVQSGLEVVQTSAQSRPGILARLFRSRS